MDEGSVLALEHITKRFGPVLALDDVTLRCQAGRVHALLGENGAGKSTLLGVLGGAHQPTHGSLRIGGEDIDFSSYDPHTARAKGVAVVHQELALVPAMSVVDNIFLGQERRRGRRLDRDGMRRAAEDALRRLDARIDVDAPVESLSVAQAQLVEIARALVSDTRVLALDEPSAVLAGHELEALFAVIGRLRSEGVAILYVSHRLDEIFEICDDFTVLKDGRLAGHGEVAQVTRDDLIRMMVGREVSDVFPTAAGGPGGPLLRVDGLRVDGVLEDISLTAHAGEILGLAGLIGSGRTTLAKALFGAVPVSAGTVEVAGVRGPFSSPRQALAAGLAYLPEDRKVEGLALDKSVRWNTTFLRAPRLRSAVRLIRGAEERRLTAESVRRFAIRTNPDGSDNAAQLSGGNQQKVVLAKWLLVDPRVLILDEPTRGIDVGAKEQIYEVLRGLADEGRAVIVISSELIEVVGLCDRVLVLSEGRLTGELAGEDVTEESIMRLATPPQRPRQVAAT